MSCLRVDYINHHLILFYYVSSIFLSFHLACPLFYFSSTHHIILTLISPFIPYSSIPSSSIPSSPISTSSSSFIYFIFFPSSFLLHSCYSFHSCRSLSTLACSQSMTWAMTLAFHPPLEKMTVMNDWLLLYFCTVYLFVFTYLLHHLLFSS